MIEERATDPDGTARGDDTGRSLPITAQSAPLAVLDLVSRLSAVGFRVPAPTNIYGPQHQAAVREFQQSRGLPATGECDPITWTALIEAGHRLGTRMLYLTAPMMRGEDVAELQVRLGTLGFDCGRVDGIFGEHTLAAVRDLQRDLGLVCDAVVGPETIGELDRLQPRGGTNSVAGVRERVQLRRIGLRGRLEMAVVHTNSDAQTVGLITSDLVDAGASVQLLADDDWSVLARTVNSADVDLCLAVELCDHSSAEIAYYGPGSGASVVGAALARAIADELPHLPEWSLPQIQALRIPILRETRPPTVRLRLGDGETVARVRDLVAAAVQRGVLAWRASGDPVQASSNG
jgi:N-acetylmuramoyl-L-alanine amidase